MQGLATTPSRLQSTINSLNRYELPAPPGCSLHLPRAGQQLRPKNGRLPVDPIPGGRETRPAENYNATLAVQMVSAQLPAAESRHPITHKRGEVPCTSPACCSAVPSAPSAATSSPWPHSPSRQAPHSPSQQSPWTSSAASSSACSRTYA